MSVPVCLFSGLTNYSTQTLSTFMLTSLYFSVQTSQYVFPCCHLFHLRLFLEQYFYCAPRPPSIAFSSIYLNCCDHPMINRIVFYFLFLSRRLIETPLSTLSLLAHCYQPSKPRKAPANNRVSVAVHSNMNVAVPILKFY